MEAVYTTAEVAERYKVRPATVQRWHQQGRLSGFPLGGNKHGRLRFSQSALDAFENGPASGDEVSPASSSTPALHLVSRLSPASRQGDDQDA
jgi:hypothetical protein